MKIKYSMYLLTALLLASCGGEESTADDSVEEEITVTDTLASDTTSEQTAHGLTFQEFSAAIRTYEININYLDSIDQLFQQNKAGFSQAEKDSAALLYIGHMQKIVGRIESEDRGNNYDKMVKKYEPYGFNVSGGEGYLWLIADKNAVGKKFEDDISSELREYLRLGEVTGKQYTADAGMLISYEEWGKLLTDLEDRLRANKDSNYYPEFLSTYKSYLLWYMYGMDNTPITNWGEEPVGLNEEVKKAYNKMMADTDHKTGKIIEKHLEKLEASNYDLNWDNRWELTDKEVEELLEL